MHSQHRKDPRAKPSLGRPCGWGLATSARCPFRNPKPRGSRLSSKVLGVLIAGLDHVLALFGERNLVETLAWPQSLNRSSYSTRRQTASGQTRGDRLSWNSIRLRVCLQRGDQNVCMHTP
jgi:hypothetical protein